MTTGLAPLAAPLRECSFDDLLAEAVSFHGHLCPGPVLGVRMTLAGCRAVGIEEPRRAGKGLVVFVEIDRCATDAIQALTGVSLGKRSSECERRLDVDVRRFLDLEVENLGDSQ